MILSQNLSYRLILLGLALFSLLAAFELRAEITFTPATPSVVVGEKISLSVSGTVGEMTWSAQKGWIEIEGTGTSVTYTAPDQPGWDVVTVLDSTANVGTLTIKIKAQTQDFSQENAIWKVWTNRDSVQELAYSKDKKTLWIGTSGGLEKRNALTGEIEKVYINTDGLPHNNVVALLSDQQGGVWVGTWDGLAHLNADSTWNVFKEEGSDLPSDRISALLSDEQGGLWVGTFGGLAHLKADGSWEVFDRNNSGLPSSNRVYVLLSDAQGGIWVGMNDSSGGGGLAHMKEDGSWKVFNTDNSVLPYDLVDALLLDERDLGGNS
jgi:ligand-binding sensor domain-containing protein